MERINLSGVNVSTFVVKLSGRDRNNTGKSKIDLSVSSILKIFMTPGKLRLNCRWPSFNLRNVESDNTYNMASQNKPYRYRQHRKGSSRDAHDRTNGWN
jgi:hypothetical protein